ncbi:DNA polymerase III subunit alpha [Neorhodopirellula pilleata]|uniref:DNA polymerase III subunit alpha n=1 Tax=Neorhodopirellula pilleata TaxID=2714738 RepID=A0A5C6AI95_9BACT|nr:DNA polymerase III subunit alpha [Neorhodopirellula pilleata]TWT98968.1 DNA polymerase III subunit alpha [Neorhodopirellula pilleata]
MSNTILAPEMEIQAATEIPPFVHLHCHSHYSLLDGAGDIGKLVKRAVDHGMNALALTDHGNLHGALEFYRKAKDAGINPIIGYEAYIAPGSRFDKGGASSSKAASYHLTLLAQNRQGFKNLIKLASAASLEGFYFKPRIDKEILEKYSEGIVCLSGCVSSEFSRAVLKGIDTAEHEAEARNIAGWFHNVFGDRYFIEIMNNDVDIQRHQLEGAVEIAKRMGLPLVATSDCHYVNQEDSEAQDIMLCINTGRFRTDNTRMKMENDQFFLRSPQQMYEKFPGLEDAVARSQQIADTVDIELEFNKYFFPSFPCPDEKTPLQYLRELCEKGLMERYEGDPERIIDGKLSDEVMARLDRELDVIEKLGYPTYFLIVWDFVNHARDIGISATARGSGVGAIVCYALYMSHVCPLRYDLLFERFLDESRTEPPDIDIDFEKERRIEVIDYVKERYGSEMVCQIGTFGTLAAKAAIKDTGRALGIPLSRVNQITELVPDELKITIAKALDKSADLKMIYDGDPEIRELLDLAMKIEGLARNVGTHAAAVVIADKPLTEYVPLGRVPGKQDVITQWAMADVEASGLLKMDFLGLRNLTILSRTVKLVEQTTGETIDPLKFPLDDKASYALLQRGETKGVFQLESGGIRDLLQRMKPDRFNDIIATAALYRPGPLEGGMVDDYVNIKHGRQQPEYKHPVLKEILEETNSIMVYQEQVMRILNRLGDVPLAKAYTCIKAISKKKQALIDANHDVFIEGSVKNGLAASDAEDIWNLIVKFAGYGFNKCVVGDTLIVDATTGEQTTVEELFRSKKPFTIEALDEHQKLVPRKVTDVVWNGVRDVFEVVTRTGRRIVATANHPLKTYDGWTNVEDLNVGDRVGVAREVSIETTVRKLVAQNRAMSGLTWRDLERESGVSIREFCRVGESRKRGFQRSTVNRLANFFDSPELAEIAQSDIFWDEIVSIEAMGKADVYDLTVDVDHNFVANGLIVHNSHSTAYALVAYQTAYLKAHYPVEFMAALLSSDISGRNFKRKDALVEHMEDCERMNIDVIPPDVNTSEADFSVLDGKIPFALSAIKACGGSTAISIETERKKNGPFKDLFDFCERVDPHDCNRSAIETLIKAGAFDSFGAKRSQLTVMIERAMQAGAKVQADKKTGQASFFDAFDDDEESDGGSAATPAVPMPDIEEWPDREKLLSEKEVLGFYLHSHPLAEFEPKLATFRTHTTASLTECKDRDEVVVGGMLSSIKLAHTKNPKPGAPSKYANFDLEDMQGNVRCICWPKQFAVCGERIQPDAVVLAKCKVDRRGGGDEVNLIVDDLTPLDELDSRYTHGMRIRLDEAEHDENTISKVREIIRGYPGTKELLLSMALQEGETIHFKANKFRVDITPQLRERLDDLLGSGHYKLLMSKPQR